MQQSSQCQTCPATCHGRWATADTARLSSLPFSPRACASSVSHAGRSPSSGFFPLLLRSSTARPHQRPPRFSSRAAFRAPVPRCCPCRNRSSRRPLLQQARASPISSLRLPSAEPSSLRRSLVCSRCSSIGSAVSLPSTSSVSPKQPPFLSWSVPSCSRASVAIHGGRTHGTRRPVFCPCVVASFSLLVISFSKSQS